MIKRHIYNQILETLKNKQIPIIMGLRRIGKTTTLKMLAEELINCRIISADSFNNLAMSDIEFYNHLDYLAKKYTYLLIDEIQVRKNWDVMIKSLFDKYVAEKKCNIVITGSSSLTLAKKELGVNRTKRLIMETWDFDEYCKLTKKLKNIDNFEKYIGKGGFPDYFNSAKSFQEILEETLKPIIGDDILKAYPGTNTLQLIRFIKELAFLTNGEVNEMSLSKKLVIDIRTVKKYIDVLENSRLLKKVYRIDKRGSLGKKRKYKVYLNPHFHIMLLDKSFGALGNKQKGHIIESYWIHWAKSINGYWKTFYYLKDTKTNEEIDLVSLQNDGSFKTLHEFKYKNKINNYDLKNLSGIESINKIVWTKNQEKDLSFKSISILDINDN